MSTSSKGAYARGVAMGHHPKFFRIVLRFWYSLFSQIVYLFTSVVNKILRKISKIIINIPYDLWLGAPINAELIVQ